MDEYYSREEFIEDGGSFVKTNNSGAEMLNFKKQDDGCFYGYVKVPHDGNIDIQKRFRAEKGATAVNGILVVFCSSRPNNGSERVVVGWYKNATVPSVFIYRPHQDGQDDGTARVVATETTLVPSSQRSFRIPRVSEGLDIGGMGQAYTWYEINEPVARKFKNELVDYILDFEDSDLNEDDSMEPINEERPVPTDGIPKNVILFGPPGTGKTYKTVEKAVDICGVPASTDRKLLLESYDRLCVERRIEFITFHQNYSYEDFIEGIRPSLDNSGSLAYKLHEGIFKRIVRIAKGDPDQNYVLIIDEINRGNIAKIFGELITLIEDSRREGGDEATTVKLPYSGEDFSVPVNLFLLGTMNTADRSIQLLDTALRRRFTFEELMPNEKHDLIATNIDGVNCQEMLRAMNERITVLLDREHQIGHTYLLRVEDIDQLAEKFQIRFFHFCKSTSLTIGRRLTRSLAITHL